MNPPRHGREVWVWLALLALLLLSLGSAFIPMGAFNGVANVGIAVVKAGLVLVFFMRVRKRPQAARLFLIIAPLLLLLLGSLSFTDQHTRGEPVRGVHPDVQPAVASPRT